MFEIRRREAKKKSVMPAETGIQGWWGGIRKAWIPAFAGMTKKNRLRVQSNNRAKKLVEAETTANFRQAHCAKKVHFAFFSEAALDSWV
jgi:hypothetical protein